MTQTSVYYICPNDREIVRWVNGELNIVEGYPFDPLDTSEFIDELIVTEKMDYDTQCLVESRKISNFINDYIDERTQQHNMEKNSGMTQKRDAKKDLEFLDKSCVTAVFSISEYWIKESEKMKARTNQLASESSKQFVAMTNALMRAESAERELEAQRIRADRYQNMYQEQEKQMLKWTSDDSDMKEVFKDRMREEMNERNESQAKLILVEQECDKLINLLEKIETALEYHEWTDYMQYVSDEITAYRES